MLNVYFAVRFARFVVMLRWFGVVMVLFWSFDGPFVVAQYLVVDRTVHKLSSLDDFHARAVNNLVPRTVRKVAVIHQIERQMESVIPVQDTAVRTPLVHEENQSSVLAHTLHFLDGLPRVQVVFEAEGVNYSVKLIVFERHACVRRCLLLHILQLVLDFV